MARRLYARFTSSCDAPRDRPRTPYGSRTFVLADGMEVLGADLSNGLLSIDLVRPEAARMVRRIDITSRD